MNSEQKCGEASEARRVRYPIGVQAFSQVRCDDGVYVGKTAFVYKLAHGDGKFFLSLTPLGWKSLLVSTLQEYFEGNKDLFKELEVSRLEQAVTSSRSSCF